jgi:hypothetical protein
LILFWFFAGVKTHLVELHPLEFQGSPGHILSVAYGEGRTFLACPIQGTVLQYDEHGKALQTIGKKGQGPGEFNWPCLVFYQAPHLYVCDTNQQKIYRIEPSTGKFLKYWSLKGAAAISIKRNELLTAFVDPLKDKVLGIADLKEDLSFRRLLGDSPCCLDVSGSHKGAVLHASDGTLWAAFSGDYKIYHFDSAGQVLARITKAPLEYVTPSQKKGISRYDTSALSENVRSFDKMDGLFELGEYILLYRYKTLSNSTVDLYSKKGKYLSSLKVDNLAPVAVVGKALYVLRETPANSKWDVELCSLTIDL